MYYLAMPHGTNNAAEFNLLKLALDDTLARFESNTIDPKTPELGIETVTAIVRNRPVVKNMIFKNYPRSQRRSENNDTVRQVRGDLERARE
jgi:hypothetical protein